MDDLSEICKTLLDNADADISLDAQTGTIRILFTTGDSLGSLVQVTFECRRFHSFKLIKDPEDDNALFVGETRVTKITASEDIDRWLGSENWTWGESDRPEILYRIELLGGVVLSILCEEFTWKVERRTTGA